MRKLIKTFGLVALIAAVLFACSGKSDSNSDKKDAGSSKSTTKNEALSNEIKAQNVVKNMTLIYTGAMVVMMDQMFADMSDMDMSDQDAAQAAIEKKITENKDELFADFGDMISEIDSNFMVMKTENPDEYNKVFGLDIMKEGIAAAEKYELPDGFRPLTQNLTKEEIENYIVHLMVSAQDTLHPVNKALMEVGSWMEKAQENPDFAAFMSSEQQ